MFLPVLFTFLLHATAQAEFSYNRFSGQFLDISGKGNNLWAVFCNNTVVRANLGADGSFQSWTAVSTSGIPAGQKVISVAASPDGTAYAVTDAYNYNVFGYNTDTTTWRSIVGGNGGHSTVDQVSSCGKTCTIGIDRNKDSFWGLNWGMAPLNLKGNWAAIGADASRWLVDTSGRIKRCVVTPALVASYNTSWSTWCPGHIWEVMCLRGVETVEAQNKDRAVVTNWFGEIYLWDGKKWTRVPYPGKATRASVSENWLYWLNEEGEAFYGRYQ